MHTIDQQTWSRREHFNTYRRFDHPHFGMCANVDLSAFYPVIKEQRYSISIAIVYVLTRAANAAPEFRYRIRGEEVVEHDVVHPSITILTGEETFSFCYIDYVEDFADFAAGAEEKIAFFRAHPTMQDPSGRDDLLFMTAIPWVSFTSFVHPWHLDPPDSFPRIAWGKFFNQANRLRMPLDVQVHHALMDGLHVGRYYDGVQDLLSDPGFVG